MNFLPSLLIYNPLEALLLIVSIHVIEPSSRYRKFRISNCYENNGKFVGLKSFIFIMVLGAVNLFVQYIPAFAPEGIFQFVFMAISSFVGIPVVLWMFLRTKYSFKSCIFATGLLFASLVIANNLFKEVILGYNSMGINKEFALNMVIRATHALLIFICNIGVVIYDKFSKKNTEKC